MKSNAKVTIQFFAQYSKGKEELMEKLSEEFKKFSLEDLSTIAQLSLDQNIKSLAQSEINRREFVNSYSEKERMKSALEDFFQTQQYKLERLKSKEKLDFLKGKFKNLSIQDLNFITQTTCDEKVKLLAQEEIQKNKQTSVSKETNP